MEYSAQFTFREEWVDARLAYGRFEDESTEVPPFVVLATSENADQSQQIWMPDTFFQNEKWVHSAPGASALSAGVLQADTWPQSRLMLRSECPIDSRMNCECSDFPSSFGGTSGAKALTSPPMPLRSPYMCFLGRLA
ncbi:hypothetical protein ANCDUO_04903 [Ancylostoma duodenale]|uniref:Neurotransmitter-gated ion-channel ligand-binding domain-containing protein n=1 Tax=Ancylostoma duodenale TaxID=51022 RepID=A0A0C2GZX5_9BILA|nr:hypothetical protein ANCDUO_04903 [Ancylostoma duodenale]